MKSSNRQKRPTGSGRVECTDVEYNVTNANRLHSIAAPTHTECQQSTAGI